MNIGEGGGVAFCSFGVLGLGPKVWDYVKIEVLSCDNKTFFYFYRVSGFRV